MSRVTSRRLAQGHGRKGFGNASEVRKLFERVVQEAKLRYVKGQTPTLTVEDIIGKEPTRKNMVSFIRRQKKE